MKTIAILTIVLLSSAICRGQGEIQSASADHQRSSILRVRNELHDPVYNANLEDLCERYRSIKISGIVMASVGAGVVTSGVIIHLKTSITGNTSNDETYAAKKNMILHNGGTAAIVLGALTVATGAPMIAIGSIKNKRTCGGQPSKVIIQSDDNGVGMGLKF